MSVKNSINTASGELSLLMCGASPFSSLLQDQQTDGFLCSFLEAVPRLVILRHLLQLGARLLVLRLLVLLQIQKIHLLNR